MPAFFVLSEALGWGVQGPVPSHSEWVHAHSPSYSPPHPFTPRGPYKCWSLLKVRTPSAVRGTPCLYCSASFLTLQGRGAGGGDGPGGIVPPLLFRAPTLRYYHYSKWLKAFFPFLLVSFIGSSDTRCLNNGSSRSAELLTFFFSCLLCVYCLSLFQALSSSLCVLHTNPLLVFCAAHDIFHSVIWLVTFTVFPPFFFFIVKIIKHIEK